MKARSVARELALLTLFPMDGSANHVQIDKTAFNELTLNAIRALKGLAQEQIADVNDTVNSLVDALVDYEITHPDNENIPLERPTLAVPVPTTQAMIAQLQNLLRAISQLEEALYLPEVLTLSQREDVQNYTMMLVKNTLVHKKEIDAEINEAATDWSVDRFHKMDLLIVRLAVCELRYSQNVEPATIIDEYLELAKQYTTDESRKFIHGILGAITSAEVKPGV